MHWNAGNGRDHEALRRLAVVLLTLAAIAESVARRSAPVRIILLWLLSRAEVRTREFAFAAGAGDALASVSLGSPVLLSGGSGEAARLVRAFRAHAAIFFALARQARQWLLLARPHKTARQFANRRSLAGHGRRPGASHLSFTDTS